MKRREFLYGMVGTGTVARTKSRIRDPIETRSELPKIKEYRTLGRTGFKVSDLGTGGAREESLLKTARVQGINYIDPAESYLNGASERGSSSHRPSKSSELEGPLYNQPRAS
jgi:hypothetical protein